MSLSAAAWFISFLFPSSVPAWPQNICDVCAVPRNIRGSYGRDGCWFQDGHAACRHLSFAPHFRYSSKSSAICLPLPPHTIRAAGLSTLNLTRSPSDEDRDRGAYVAQTSKRQISCLLLPR
ncbi:uncharacterized protein BDZ83DRAFT_41384 [Colletotrichum acutatum]|uniref:Secreted protein n=1 Tax=Glomerella acutata TaxID=27357 RepID=A0AAD8XAY8_GLOAC|nr:uncharacterized protein BDZ83DRAFT_41384 [Colletotrichum acutatum]KAK1716662.1 hypothetical protein BDZ83DRAFT_41384 [Colletotrichum acutatum]